MNATFAIEKILKLGLTNDNCGTIVTSSSPLDDCELNFGYFRPIIDPLTNKTYLYEWKAAESPNEIEEPDALLIQTSVVGTMLVYLYELTND